VSLNCWVGPGCHSCTAHCTTALATWCVEGSHRAAGTTSQTYSNKSLKLDWVSKASAYAIVAMLEVPGAAVRHVLKRQFTSEVPVLTGRHAFYESITTLCWAFDGVPELWARPQRLEVCRLGSGHLTCVVA
jgi:hypothetical protein